MIDESWYWRVDLRKRAASLRKRMTQKRWTATSSARCEQTVMLGFFSVRKLIESRKLTEDFASRQVQVDVYAPTGKHIHFLNVHKLEEAFDLQKNEARVVTVRHLCNQIVHSYIFNFVFGEESFLEYILVTSDTSRKRELLQLSLKAIIEIFDLASDGEVNEAIAFSYDEELGDYVVRMAEKRTLKVIRG
jgi:hypothetical protein